MLERGFKSELFSDFLQRLAKDVQIGATDPEARKVLMESLAFKNVNLKCKKLLRTLKVRSAPMGEWIMYIMNFETFYYNTVTWVGEAYSKI